MVIKSEISLLLLACVAGSPPPVPHTLQRYLSSEIPTLSEPPKNHLRANLIGGLRAAAVAGLTAASVSGFGNEMIDEILQSEKLQDVISKGERLASSLEEVAGELGFELDIWDELDGEFKAEQQRLLDSLIDPFSLMVKEEKKEDGQDYSNDLLNLFGQEEDVFVHVEKSQGFIPLFEEEEATGYGFMDPEPTRTDQQELVSDAEIEREYVADRLIQMRRLKIKYQLEALKAELSVGKKEKAVRYSELAKTLGFSAPVATEPIEPPRTKKHTCLCKRPRKEDQEPYDDHDSHEDHTVEAESRTASSRTLGCMSWLPGRRMNTFSVSSPVKFGLFVFANIADKLKEKMMILRMKKDITESIKALQAVVTQYADIPTLLAIGRIPSPEYRDKTRQDIYELKHDIRTKVIPPVIDALVTLDFTMMDYEEKAAIVFERALEIDTLDNSLSHFSSLLASPKTPLAFIEQLMKMHKPFMHRLRRTKHLLKVALNLKYSTDTKRPILGSAKDQVVTKETSCLYKCSTSEEFNPPVVY